jgi:hypothetical protein
MEADMENNTTHGRIAKAVLCRSKKGRDMMVLSWRNTDTNEKLGSQFLHTPADPERDSAGRWTEESRWVLRDLAAAARVDCFGGVDYPELAAAVVGLRASVVQEENNGFKTVRVLSIKSEEPA